MPNSRFFLAILLVAPLFGAHAEFSIENPRLNDFVLPSFEREAANPRAAFRTVHGAATKGPIANAAISVFELDDTGQRVGSAVATSTSDSSGEFSLSIPSSASGMLLVQTNGGSFIDESDTRPLEQRRRITLGENDSFFSIILNSQSTVAVTPYTDALVHRAAASSLFGGFKDRMQSLMMASESGFGFSLFETLPADPAAPSTNATQPAMQYALLLGAFANIANTVALHVGLPAPTYEVIRAVMQDLSDGDLDGTEYELAQFANDKAIPAVDFDQQLIRFRNNNYQNYADTPLPDWDTAEEDLAGDFPPGFFFSLAIFPGPRIWGVRAFGLSETLRLSGGIGVQANAAGEGLYFWGIVDGKLIMDFEPFGGKLASESVSFNANDSGGQDEILNQIFRQKFEVEIEEDLGDRVVVFVKAVNRSVTTNVTTGEVLNESNFDTSGTVTAFNFKDSPTWDDPATFEESPALPALLNGQPPAPTFSERLRNVDNMVFNADGTGRARIEGEDFTWELVNKDRVLRVLYNESGEEVYYVIVLSDDPELGDFVAAEHRIGEDRYFTGATVISNFEDLTYTQDSAPAIRSWGFSATRSDGTLVDFEQYDYFFPDGTGMTVGGPQALETSDSPLLFRIGFCWHIDENGVLVVEDEFGSTISYPLPADCVDGGNTDGNRLTIELYDEFNGREDQLVTFGPNDGSGTLWGVLGEIGQVDETYNANPPILLGDGINGSSGLPITLNVLDNDFVKDFPIDVSTIEVTSDPIRRSPREKANGTVSVNTETGEMTYIPDSSDTSERTVWVNYQVRDTAGNLAAPAVVSFNINTSTSASEDGQLAKEKALTNEMSIVDRYMNPQSN